MSEADVRRVIADADVYQPPAVAPTSFSSFSSFSRGTDPEPLIRELPDPEPYPIEALGPRLAPAAAAIQEKTQAPDGICAQSVLAAVTLAAQPFCNIHPPVGSPRPLSEFFLTVAESGDRKTTSDDYALEPVTMLEKSLASAYDQERQDHENVAAVWDTERKQILQNKKIGTEEKTKQLGDLGPKPEPPAPPIRTMDEPTLEGLIKLFAIGSPSLGMFSSEGGQFLGGFGMTKDNRIKTAAGLSALWDGKAIKRVRAGDGSSNLPGRRLTIHLMVQPQLSSDLLADERLQDQGLLSRMLISAPKSLAGTRFHREVSQESTENFDRYVDWMLALLNRPMPCSDRALGLEPATLRMDPKAAMTWVKFSDCVEKDRGPSGSLASIRPFANKMPEHAARLAGVLAVVEDPDGRTVSADQICRGIELVLYYGSEAQRLTDVAHVDEKLLLAGRVLAWLRDGWTEALVSLPDIYQRGPAAIRDRKSATSVVETLEEHGWLARVPDGAEVDGKRRSDVWMIHGK